MRILGNNDQSLNDLINIFPKTFSTPETRFDVDEVRKFKIIDEVNALRDNSVDYYAAVRSSYYQNRKAAIMNTDDDILTPLPLISIEFE